MPNIEICREFGEWHNTEKLLQLAILQTKVDDPEQDHCSNALNPVGFPRRPARRLEPEKAKSRHAPTIEPTGTPCFQQSERNCKTAARQFGRRACCCSR